MGHGRRRRSHRTDAAAGRTQREGKRGRRRRSGREHAVGLGAAPRRHRQVDVEGRRSASSTPTPRAGCSWPTRCGTARTASSRLADGRSGDLDRRHHRRARPRLCRALCEQRRARRSSRRGRQVESAKKLLAPAARRGSPTTGLIDSDAADVKNIAGRPRRRQHNRRPVRAALCQQGAVGASRHRRGRLVEKRCADRTEGRHRVRRCACSTGSSPITLRARLTHGVAEIGFYHVAVDAAGARAAAPSWSVRCAMGIGSSSKPARRSGSSI